MLWIKKKMQIRNKHLQRLIVFFKAQLSAFIGGITDYSVMIFFTEVFNVHYTISIAIGGVIGAIINFGLNKTWTFKSKHRKYSSGIIGQLWKFILVVCGSILLKSSGTFLITNFVKIDYKISRLIVDLFVSLLFNFNLQKHWVFRKERIPSESH